MYADGHPHRDFINCELGYYCESFRAYSQMIVILDVELQSSLGKELGAHNLIKWAGDEEKITFKPY